MPLPDENVPWPPPHLKEALDLYTRWGAWYSGEAEQLARVYSVVPGIDHGADLPSGQPIGPRFLAGITRGLQRMFWGAAPSSGQTRGHKLHIPLAGDLAMTSADLVFGEPPVMRIPDVKSDDPTQARLDTIIEESNAHAVWLEGAEIASAYGGAYHRVRWDPVLSDGPLFDTVPPDAGVPEFRGGRLVAVTLWRDLQRPDARWWRHLERHEPGKVLHGLYVSRDEGKLGQRVDLAQHDETAPFAVLVDPGDRTTVETGATGLTCEYVPNMRPHRTLRGSPLGRSDYAGIEPIMDSLDEVWTSWMRDVRLGKGRLVVPSSYVQSMGRGKGGHFDLEREVYEAVDALDTGEGSGLSISVVQFEIRVEEHSRTARELAAKAQSSAGYSPQTFGESDQVAATATEVVSREAASFRTRKRKIGYQRGALARLSLTALQIDVAKFGRTGIRPVLPTIEWPDGVTTDPEALARTISLIHAAEAASIETRVKMQNPDWEEHQVRAEVLRIKEEKGGVQVGPPGAAATGQGPDGKAAADEDEDEDEESSPAADIAREKAEREQPARS